MKLVHQGTLLLFGPLFVQLVAASALFYFYSKAENSSMRRTRATEIRSLTDKIWAVNVNVALEISGLQTGSGSKERLAEIAKEMKPLLIELRNKGNITNKSDSVHEFEVTVNNLLKREMTLAKSIDEDGLDIPFYGMGLLRGELKASLLKVNKLKKIVEDEANKESTEQTLNEAQSRTVVNICLGFLMLFTIAATAFAATIFYKNIASRYAIILENSRRFGRREPIAQEVGGSDEIADLDKTFHEMWNAVEEALRRERAMIDNAVDVICSVNEFGTFTAVSPAAERMWGYEPNELIGKNLALLVVPTHKETAFAALTKARQSGENTSFETEIATQYGGTRHMQWSVQWSNRDLTFFCVVHDISDRKAIERLKQDFVNMISHDLKTPLTAVRLTLELVHKGVYGEIDAKGQNRIAVAQDSTQRLLELINQLLQLEKLEAGKMELHKTPSTVLKLLKTACDSVETFAEQHEVWTEIVCEDTLTAMLDEDRIVQVLINLISNAIKFSPPNKAIIVSAELDEDELCLCVEDFGRGVPEHLRTAIFNRFEQVDRSDSTEKGGTGLGLAICKAIVKAHDGQIGVNSEEGQGSVFWIRIPLVTTPEGSRAETVDVSL